MKTMRPGFFIEGNNIDFGACMIFTLTLIFVYIVIVKVMEVVYIVTGKMQKYRMVKSD